MNISLARVVNWGRNWRDVLLEVRLLAGDSDGLRAPLSFPVEVESLRGIRVQWPIRYSYTEAGKWVDHVRVGLGCFLPVEFVDVDVQNTGEESVPITFWLVANGTRCPVVLDYCDYMDRIDLGMAESSLIYFKMQYRRSGYQECGRLSGKIVPGGYVCGSPRLYKYLQAVREKADIKAYTTDVYGRFGLRFAVEARKKAYDLLSNQAYFRYRGGFVLKRYVRFLMECAEAKICIDLPSNSDFCFRLIEYMAVGCCIIAPRYRTRFPVDLEDRKHIVYSDRDVGDLVDLCRYYLGHDSEREAIRENARHYFDSCLHRQQLGAYYLHECLSRMC